MSAWPDGKTYRLQGLQATVSAPVLLGRCKTHFWFPQLCARGEDILALVRLGANLFEEDTAVLSWSHNRGLTWRPPSSPITQQSSSQLSLDSGVLVCLPYRLFPRPLLGGIGASCNVIRKGKHEAEKLQPGVLVTGWPDAEVASSIWGRTDAHRKWGLSGWFFDGQPLRLKDGRFLTTMFGSFKGSEHFTVAVVDSADGLNWRFRAIVGDRISQPTACLLKDGSLMCIGRVDGQQLYSQCWSSDEGKTWSAPQIMSVAGSVEPRLAVLNDRVALLAGGRPDLNLWVDPVCSGKTWQKIDLIEHHNAFHKQEPILRHGEVVNYGFGRSSAYCSILPLDATHLLCAYDRTPTSSNKEAVPCADKKNSTDPAESFSIWVTQVTLGRPADRA